MMEIDLGLFTKVSNESKLLEVVRHSIENKELVKSHRGKIPARLHHYRRI